MIKLRPNTSSLFVSSNGQLTFKPGILEVLFSGYIQFVTLATFVFDEILCIYGLYLSIHKGMPNGGISEYLLLGTIVGIMIPVAIFLFSIYTADLRKNKTLQLYHS